MMQPASPLVVQPLVPGLSSAAGPSFSYNISQSNQQFQTSTVTFIFLSKYEVLLNYIALLLMHT